jgi:hypothetical protein
MLMIKKLKVKKWFFKKNSSQRTKKILSAKNFSPRVLFALSEEIIRREHEIKLSSKNIALGEASVSRIGRGSDRRSGGVGGGRGG